MLNKRILLGITGGIAAYKIAFLIRLLKKEGAEVKCIMTPASCDFISPLVVATLSENPVGIEFWNKADGSWVNHVEYGLWADLLVIAPATANSLAKMATGSCDNLLLATYLSNKSKTMIAPAMDLDMYAHPTTKRNLEQLQADGVKIIPAESGFLASGLQGEGRMAEPETILQHIQMELLSSDELKGKKILVTAGPTYESIDPVRYIGNHSSGKMGYDIAEALAHKGAEVLSLSINCCTSVYPGRTDCNCRTIIESGTDQLESDGRRNFQCRCCRLPAKRCRSGKNKEKGRRTHATPGQKSGCASMGGCS